MLTSQARSTARLMSRETSTRPSSFMAYESPAGPKLPVALVSCGLTSLPTAQCCPVFQD